MSPEQIEWRWKRDSTTKASFQLVTKIGWMDDCFFEKTRCVLLQFPVGTNLTWLQSKGSSIFLLRERERDEQDKHALVLEFFLRLLCWLASCSCCRLEWCGVEKPENWREVFTKGNRCCWWFAFNIPQH